jgi:hypothetical protein
MVSDNVVNAGQVASGFTLDNTLIVLIIAVVVSLVIGIGNIVLTKNIEARKYKYEVLKDICDWLELVIRCGGEVNLKFMKTPVITPRKEKKIAEEAIAKYLLVSSRINFISKIASLAGIPRSSLKDIENGIIDVMETIDGQLDSKKFNIPSLYTDHMMPLNNKCSDLMGQIALALGKEVKLRSSEILTLNEEPESKNESDNIR